MNVRQMNRNTHSSKRTRAVAIERAAEQEDVLSTGEGMLLLGALSAVIVSLLSFAIL